MKTTTIPEGDGDDTTDLIPEPQPPVLEIINSIIKIYEIDVNDLIDLSNDLWTPDFLQQLVNIMANPIDAIISLGIIFIGGFDRSSKEPLYIGNIKSTAKAYPIINSSFKKKTQPLYIPLYYGNFHDYNKSNVMLYLPFCGVIKLPNYVMGKSVQISYTIDIMSLNALILITCFIQNVEIVIDRRTVNIGYRVPLSGKNSEAYLSGLFTNPFTMFTDNSKVQASSLNGNAQYLDVQYPYVVIERNDLVIPSCYPSLSGGVNETYGILSNITGFVKVSDINLNIPNATSQEKNIIERLLKEGVFL